MNMNTMRTYGILLLLFAFGALAFSCGDDSVDASDEARTTSEEEASEISIQSWGLVLKDYYGDEWRLSKHYTQGNIIYLKGEWSYRSTCPVAAQYNTSTKILSLSTKYKDWTMCEIVTYYGNNKFSGYYNYSDITSTGSDRLTIMQNNSGILFQQEALSKSESDIDSELPQMDTIRERRSVDEGIVL